MTSPWNDGSVDCPVCGECRAFALSELNPAAGYCEVENKTYTICPGEGARLVICGICGRQSMAAFMSDHVNAGGRMEKICSRCKDASRSV